MITTIPANILTKPSPWCLAPGFFEGLSSVATYAGKAPAPLAGEPAADFGARCDSWRDYIRSLADKEHGLQIDPASGIAVQPVSGTILKGADPEYEVWCGFFDLDRITAACQRATTDEAIRALVFLWDSPGGYSGGITGVLRAMAALRAARPDLPVLSYIPDYCASLAYWIACGTQEVHASEDAMVGSIGSYILTTDSLGYYRAMGLEIQLISSGDYKGMGSPGVGWKPEWYAQVREQVDRVGDRFRATVSHHRPAVAADRMDGRCFEAPAVSGPGNLVDSTRFPTAAAFLSAVMDYLPQRI